MIADDNKYTIEELLRNESFIQSILNPTTENHKFWQTLIDEGKLSPDDYEQAQAVVKSIVPECQLMKEEELNELWTKIEIENKRQLRNKIIRFYRLTAIAACMGLILGMSYFLIHFIHSNHAEEDYFTSIESVQKPEKEAEDIQLVLSDKKQISLEGKNAEVKYDASGKIEANSKSVASGTKTADEKTNDQFDQIIVPKGKRSTLMLADGTFLHINAGTRVVYPKVFDKKNRVIYVEGEVYLDVAHDQSRPFIVRTKRMDIRVLGTSFNVTAYVEDDTDAVVLVKGSVKVKTKSEQALELTPGDMLMCNNTSSSVSQVDVYNHILWKDGLYQFKSENLTSILTRLSRYYGVVITNKISNDKNRYSGKLDLKDDLNIVLDGLSRIASFSYEKTNDTIIVTKN